MYEWLLILATHVNSGSNVQFQRFATQNECVAVKQWTLDSYYNQGISLKTEIGRPIITCMKVKKL